MDVYERSIGMYLKFHLFSLIEVQQLFRKTRRCLSRLIYNMYFTNEMNCVFLFLLAI